MPISREDVWQAADRVAATGLKATLDAVRKELGGGSLSTLSDAMKEWRRRQREQEGQPAEPIPQQLTTQLEVLGRAVWRIASHLAADRLRTDYQAFQAEREELESTQAEAIEVAVQTSQELAALQIELQASQAAISTKSEDLNKLRGRLGEVTQQLAAAQAQATEAERRIGDLNRELERVSQANADLISALASRAQGKASGKA